MALPHLLWAELDLLCQTLLESFLGGWQRRGAPIAVGDLTVKCFTGQGSLGRVIKMGKRSTSRWKPRAHKFFPSFQHQCLLPKPWRSTLVDREEMVKYLLKLKYLQNQVHSCGII